MLGGHTETETNWRVQNLDLLKKKHPAESRENGFFNTDASYYLEACEAVEPGSDRDALKEVSIRFLSSNDIDEQYQSLRLLSRLKAQIPYSVADSVLKRLDSLSHNYTNSMNTTIRGLVLSMRDDEKG